MPRRLTRRNLLLTLLAAFLFLSSCRKDRNDNEGKDPTPQKKIAKLYQDPANFIEFIYNSDGSLGKLKLAQEDLGSDVRTFEVYYGDNKRIANIFIGGGNRIHYRYENDRLIATETQTSTGQIITSGSFYYENGNLVDYGSFLPFPLDDGQQGISYKRVEEYKYTYNANKTIRSIVANMRNPLTKKMEFAGRRNYELYDNKINPLKFLPDFSYGFFHELNPSNIVKEVVFNDEDSLQETIERTYTYDNHGYPLTCIEKTTEPGKPAETKTLTFTYY
jgi:hypothetical protein